MDKDFKLKSIMKEIVDEIPRVQFTMPQSVESHRDLLRRKQTGGDIYTSDVDFSKISSKSSSEPTFQEYKRHFITYEGKKNKLYIDSRGFPTVGIGHKFEAGEKRKSYYTDSEIDAFFKKDLEEAIKITKRVFPNFDSLPKEVKLKLVSLSFNLGEGGISKFKKFRSAIAKREWKNAAAELKNSRWFSQVGRRARDYVSFFNNLS